MVRPFAGLLPDLTTIVAPRKEIVSRQMYTAACIKGLFKAMIFSALEKSSWTDLETEVNFSISFSSRTKAFTTRIPWIFSCTVLFSLSKVLNTREKMPWTQRIRVKRATASKGSTMQYTTHSRGLIPIAITRAITSIIGQRMAIRIIIWKVICRLATSVVSRVMMEEVENLSMLEKSKVCTLWYISWRRFRAKPVAAWAPKKADATPKEREHIAHRASKMPFCTTTAILPALIPRSKREASTKGISTSMATSPIIHTGLKMADHLYSRMLRANRLIIVSPPKKITYILALLVLNCNMYIGKRPAKADRFLKRREVKGVFHYVTKEILLLLAYRDVLNKW